MKRVYLCETKTTSEDIARGSTFWKRTIMDPQLSLYIPALRTMGYDPIGAIYDVLYKPQQKPSNIALTDADGTKIVHDAAGNRVRTKDGKKWRETGGDGLTLQTRPETPEEYGARCLAAIIEDPDRYYGRDKVVRLEADEREAALDVWNTASQMREARRLKMYPRNPDSCIQWSRECDYLNVCSGLADINDPFLFRLEEEHVELKKENEESGLALVTQSSMRAHRSCPRKFQYRYEMRLRPLVKAETLATGGSIHEALDVFRRTGDLDLAKQALTTEDLHVRAKETAMLIGYVARWPTPRGVIAIEKQFRIPLINPATGAASRTFELGGKVDAIVEEEAALASLEPSLEHVLEESLKEATS